MRLFQIVTVLALFGLQPASGQQAFDSAKFNRDRAAGKALIEVWIRCTQSAATKLANGSKEGAEVVAVAVFGACSQNQQSFFQNLLQSKMSVPMAEDLIHQIRAKIREQVIAQVVTLRAGRP
jgi:hypothetical protein